MIPVNEIAKHYLWTILIPALLALMPVICGALRCLAPEIWMRRVAPGVYVFDFVLALMVIINVILFSGYCFYISNLFKE